MAVADDVAAWIQTSAAPAGATVHAHREPARYGPADMLIVEVERSRDGNLFGGGPGFGRGGEFEIRIGLWWKVNAGRPEPQRTPAPALNGLQPVYEAVLGVRRQTIGAMLVRHVEGGPGPVLRSTEAEDAIVAYARVTLHVQRHTA